MKYRIWTVVILILSIAIGSLIYASRSEDLHIGPFSLRTFTLGLDLSGGTELTYAADITDIAESDISHAMSSLRDVIERRVNMFGVSEPVVQIENAGVLAGDTRHQLVVELPGITDVDEAVRLIGQTPVLEFKLLDARAAAGASTTDPFIETGLTGRFLKNAKLEFIGANSGSGFGGEPYIVLNFNNEGSALFADITKNNVGNVLAIFLDGSILSSPTIQEEITGGTAQITGSFSATEARELVRNLNFGALPVPIKLINTRSIGPTLGTETVQAGVAAGFWSFILISAFLILWYRLPGFIASVSLAIYAILNLIIFQLIPVTLTAAGIAGFILSIGIAVDSNILVFERIKEEIQKKKSIKDAVSTGFSRAWTSIRDANVTGLISGVVLFWMGTSMVKGFALTLSIGILTSMLSAIIISRTFLYAISSERLSRWLFLTGLLKK